MSIRVAKRYSKALVGLCNADRGHEMVARDLELVVKAMRTNPEVAAALEDPTVGLEARRKILDEVVKGLRLRPLTARFLAYLSDKKRFGLLEAIVVDFERQRDALAGRVRATATSATPLGPLESQRLKDALQQATGKDVVLETAVNPDLLGGVVTQIGNIVLDGSVRTSLNKMREQLLGSVQ